MVTELKEVISTIEKLKDEEQRQIAKLLFFSGQQGLNGMINQKRCIGVNFLK